MENEEQVYELYLVVRVTSDMLKDTTLEEIGETLRHYAEKSGYAVDDVWAEDAE